MSADSTSPAPAHSPPGFLARLRARTRRPDPGPAVLAHRLLWRGSITLTAGVVTGLYPFVFVADQAIDVAFSPVLPSLLLLALVLAGLPFLLTELLARRWTPLAADVREIRAARFQHASRFVLGAGVLVFLVWLSMGA